MSTSCVVQGAASAGPPANIPPLASVEGGLFLLPIASDRGAPPRASLSASGTRNGETASFSSDLYNTSASPTALRARRAKVVAGEALAQLNSLNRLPSGWLPYVLVAIGKGHFAGAGVDAGDFGAPSFVQGSLDGSAIGEGNAVVLVGDVLAEFID